MFERFTNRAKTVMQLADQEAELLHQERVGTEHILLGLIAEEKGVAAHVLKRLGVDLPKARTEVKKIAKGDPTSIVLGKRGHTDRAKIAIAFAIEECRGLHHNYVGTEHILLGLLRVHEGVAAQALYRLGVSLDDVRNEILNLLGCRSDRSDADARLSDATRQAVREAEEEARRLNHGVLNTGHLLVGMIDNCGSTADRVLQGLGAIPERVRKELADLASEVPGWRSSADTRFSESLCKAIRAGTEIAVSMSPTDPLEERIARLQADKELAVANGEFEKAAKLRDRAEGLKQELGNKSRIVQPPHLLLGMLADPTCAAVRILQNLGLYPEQVRTEVLKALQSGQP